MWDTILDCFFPAFCLQCGAFGAYWCKKCQQNQKFFTTHISLEIEDPYIDQIFAACTYSLAAKKLLTSYKYDGAYVLSKTIAAVMIQHIPLPDDIQLLTSIPLHPQKQQQRGFNQAALLSQQLSIWIDIPNIEVLQKNLHTLAQAKKNKKERMSLCTNTFQKALLTPTVLGKTVAIVDDVSTTGTTLNQAARVLKQNGAKKIYGLVFAHGQ